MPVSVRFSFDDFRGELSSLRQISSSFMERGSSGIIDNLLQQLDQVRYSGRTDAQRFELSADLPLRSRPSTQFERSDRKVAFPVVGEVTWVWEIAPVANKKSKPVHFDVVGLASTKLRIRAGADGPELAMWRVELGDGNSPGCYFHTQVLGESEHPPFPHALSVPRLPSLFATPMAAVEFLLGELFQDAWEQHVAGDRGDLQFWNQIQRRRMQSLLNWKLRQIEDCQGSPWAALKRAKPEQTDDLFVARKGNR